MMKEWGTFQRDVTGTDDQRSTGILLQPKDIVWTNA